MNPAGQICPFSELCSGMPWFTTQTQTQGRRGKERRGEAFLRHTNLSGGLRIAPGTCDVQPPDVWRWTSLELTLQLNSLRSQRTCRLAKLESIEVFNFGVIALIFAGHNFKKIRLGILWQKGVCCLTAFFAPASFFLLSSSPNRSSMFFSWGVFARSSASSHDLIYHLVISDLGYSELNGFALDKSQGYPRVTHESGFVVPVHSVLHARIGLFFSHGFCVNREAKHSREGKKRPTLQMTFSTWPLNADAWWYLKARGISQRCAVVRAVCWAAIHCIAFSPRQ